jgi:hypothetical protein
MIPFLEEIINFIEIYFKKIIGLLELTWIFKEE